MTEDDPKDLRDLSFRGVLDLVLAGEEKAREELFARLGSEKSEGALLLALARRMLPRDDRLRELMETRDLVQSALKSGWLSLSEFHGSTPGEFLNWMRSILRFKVLRAIRRMRGRPPREELQEEGPAESSDLPLGTLLREEVRARVRRAIEELPDGEREVLLLRIQGMSGPQIAEKLHLSHEAVRKRESRAIGHLRGVVKFGDLENP